MSHTPGPWRWELGMNAKRVQLCGGVPEFDLTVMDFVRWGMGNAAPRFLGLGDDKWLLKRADEFVEVVPGREHHSSWFQTLNHPDARLIAAAPDLLEALEWYVENDDTMEMSDNSVWLAGRDKAIAAIKKAKGGES